PLPLLLKEGFFSFHSNTEEIRYFENKCPVIKLQPPGNKWIDLIHTPFVIAQIHKTSGCVFPAYQTTKQILVTSLSLVQVGGSKNALNVQPHKQILRKHPGGIGG